MKRKSVWKDAEKEWPEWGDLIWAHFPAPHDCTVLALVGGLNQEPDHFFEYDEGQFKGMGSMTRDCDRWCHVEPPKYEDG